MFFIYDSLKFIESLNCCLKEKFEPNLLLSGPGMRKENDALELMSDVVVIILLKVESKRMKKA